MRAIEFINETVSTGLGGGSAGSNGGQMVGGPTTYEQETDMFKRKGARRITAMTTEDEINEKWSEKYKRSINCNNPKGFSQRAHCQGRKK